MKPKDSKVSLYNNSNIKRVLDIFLSLFFIFITLPISISISVLIFVTTGMPIFFLQKRVGKNGKVFKIIKFRTMVVDAEKLQEKYAKLNESDGPVFKIVNDPRFTRVGYLLSRVGLDELPQFINVFKGDMSIVGPRPLPIIEAKKLSRDQKIREYIKPGVTSTWVTYGSHKLSFKKWMILDKEYIKNSNIILDLKIIYKTFYLVFTSLLQQFANH
jgi:lipopolysaccharide/colanic/teichoic acid biosynthesis glycosyltransferase